MRTATRTELARHVEVTARVLREPVSSVADLAHVLEAEPGSTFLLAYAAEEAIGTGVGRPSSIPGCLYAMARVLPESRRLGAGSALYAALSEQARAIGREALVGRVREDDLESRAFVRRRGFREISRECPVALDLRSATVAAEAPAGVTIVSLAERPDLAHAVWEVEAQTVGDIPSEKPLVPTPFETWRGVTLDAPGFLAEGTFVALVDGEVVGYAGLSAAGGRPGVAEHLLTAVRRAWRRRGIARALKRRQIVWAKAAGYERLLTSNDEANVAMRGINARLGYEPEPAHLFVRGPLAT